MRILFVHQSFPGQYRHIVRRLAAQGTHQLVAMGLQNPTETIPTNVTFIRYGLSRGNTPGLHDWLIDIDSKFIRGEACARASFELRQQGFYPELICVHPGWGEGLFLKDIWPNARMLCYQEFFYHSRGFDFDFDVEIQDTPDWEASARLRIKNMNPLHMLSIADWNVSPTFFQRSSFPFNYQDQISVIHDGIDTSIASPNPSLKSLTLPDGTIIYAGSPIVTFVNRTIEPYRGCHTFIRAIPQILIQHPDAHIVVVGSMSGVSYGRPAPQNSWKDFFLKEILGQCDLSTVHFTGPLPYSSYLQLLQLSSCHVYLTYPFVLSWSLLEAMSVGCPIVGSSTPPVQEVITHNLDGMLVDFFSPSLLSDMVSLLLSKPSLAFQLGSNARNKVINDYDVEKCIPRHLSLFQLVSSGVLGSS